MSSSSSDYSDDDYLYSDIDRQIQNFFSEKNSESKVKFFNYNIEWEDSSVILGHGENGPIKMVKNRQTGSIAAVKRVSTTRVMSDNIPQAHYEIFYQDQAAKTCNSIVKIIDIYFQSDVKYFYIVVEYMPQGSLLKLMHEKHYKFSLNQIREIMKQSAEALEILHNDLGVAHRDIKMENIVVNFENHADFDNLTSTLHTLAISDLPYKKRHSLKHNNSSTIQHTFQETNFRIKLIDFGFVGLIRGEYGSLLLTSTSHTPTNVAPEVYRNVRKVKKVPYNEKCDIWSLGTVFYELLFGKPPFSRCQ